MKKTIPIIFQAFFYWISYVLLKLFAHFEIKGQENLNDVKEGPIIFASNHRSYIDGGVCGAALPRSSLWPKDFLPIRFLGAERFFKWHYFPVNIIYNLGGVIKIIRAKEKKGDNSHLFEVLNEAINALKKNGKIWVFPEGGFNDDGTTKKPRNGAAFLHQQTGAPIVPVAISGNEKIFSGKVFSLKTIVGLVKSLLILNKIEVIIGKPFYSINGVSLDEKTNSIMNEVYKLKKLI